MRLVVVVGHHWPLVSGLGRPRDGPASPHSPDGWHPRCAPSEPQLTTVRHDGGCADRSRTRMHRRAPTGLSHAAMPSTRAGCAGGSVWARPWVMTSSSRSNLDACSPLGWFAAYLR